MGQMADLVDFMAQRYGTLPTELLKLDWYEFNLNVAIMRKVLDQQKRDGELQRDMKITKPIIRGNSLKIPGLEIRKNTGRKRSK